MHTCAGYQRIQKTFGPSFHQFSFQGTSEALLSFLELRRTGLKARLNMSKDMSQKCGEQ